MNDLSPARVEAESQLPDGVAFIAMRDDTIYLVGDERLSANDFQVVVGDALLPLSTSSCSAETLNAENSLADFDLAAGEPFLLPENAKFQCGINIAPEWTLPGSDTAFFEISDAAAALAIPCNPSGREYIALEAGERYRFAGYFAAHRAAAGVRLTLHDSARVAVEEFLESFDRDFPGGRNVHNYKAIEIVFTARNGARFARIELLFVEQQDPVDNLPSFIFIADPVFEKANNRKSGPDLRIIPNKPVEASVVLECRLGPNVGVIGQETIALRYGEHNISLAEAPPVRFNAKYDSGPGISLHASQAGKYAVYIDGQFEDCVFVPTAAWSFHAIDPRHYDGGPHVVEIRDRHGLFTLSKGVVVLQSALTKMEVLQREAGAAVPAHLAHAARFRYDGLAAHLRATEGKAPRQLAQLAHAHDVLVGGFDNIRRYEKLAFPKVKRPTVSVIVPAHNKFNVTYYCLCALLVAKCDVDFEVIVVDDGSSDETQDLDQFVDGVTVCRNEEAEGFVRACNMGASAARGTYLVFLNNDTEPTVGWLDELIWAIRNFKDVGIAGSRLLNPDGSLQDAGGIIWRNGSPRNYGRGQNPWDPRFGYTREVDCLSGAALMIPSTIWQKVGGFSEEFAPAYFEDTDLAFKVRDAGYRTLYVPSSIVYHFEGVTGGTDVNAGAKRNQEVNWPKFKRKWAAAFRSHGKEGANVELEKDRGVTGRALFFDYMMPRPDNDAGSYAALQEMRLFQALGFKVTFVPTNLQYLARYTDNLQRLGIETIYAPFFLSVADFLKERGEEFDVVYITRYNVANALMDLIRNYAPDAKVLFNVADLHFLREQRTALSTHEDERAHNAAKTREEELHAIGRVDLTLSYSDVEQAVIASHVMGQTQIARCPWVVDVAGEVAPFDGRKGIAFLGGYGHPPNVEAVEYFVREVMPRLRGRRDDVTFHIYGSRVPESFNALAAEDVIVEGFVEDVAEVYDRHRIFVVPLLAGAGIKGKVLGALAHGIPTIMSPIAAEGTGARGGHDCLIVERPDDWVDAIASLYDDDALWRKLSENGRAFVAEQYSFENGLRMMRNALEAVDIFPAPPR